MFSNENFLIEHALRNVWCGPGADRQYTISPTRITPIRGAIWDIDIGMSTYTLPKQSVRFDVFVFGDILPSQFGMDETTNVWVLASAQATAKKILIQLFNENGILYPLGKAWFLYTRNGNLVIALERLEKVPTFNKAALFVHWRQAAYFANTPVDTMPGIRYGYHAYTGNNASYLTFRSTWLTAKEIPYGQAVAYRNGKRIREFNPAVMSNGDHLEWVWDGDVKEVLEIKYSDLLSFDSTLDGKRKFFIPRPGLGDTIDFIDDVDFALLKYTKPLEYTGVYFSKTRKDTARMVTHRDYSLTSQYVYSAIEGMGWELTDDIRIEVTVRYSGYNRALVDEHHRIKELFKLDEDKRLDAMIGSDSGVSVWTADSLESSTYLTLMREKITSITSEQVINAYGYNAVSRLTGLVPIEVTDISQYVRLKYGQYTDCTVFEYDRDRKLIGWYPHSVGIEYATNNAECKYIEAFAGTGGLNLSTVYNNHSTSEVITLDAKRDYRFYLGQISSNNTVGTWVDITGDETYYTVNDNNEVIWGTIEERYSTAIRNDLDFLAKDLLLDSHSGMLVFSIGTDEVYPDHADVYTLMDIPPGEYDIFMNGYDLVKDIDYYVNWPEFCIVSRRYWDDTADYQKITIRARGFCKSDMTSDQPEDSGFIIHNQLSRNGRFNIRDDKVTRISIGGQLYLYDEVGFAEDGTFNEEIPNGTPYRITHPYIPMLDLVPGDSYSYRELSLSVDTEIEGYMDEYNPEPEITTPYPVESKYLVISPFISRITEDILKGIVTVDDYEQNYAQQDLADRFAGYLYLLDYDPVIRQQDSDRYEFLPHRHDSVELDLYQFRMIDRLIDIFLDGKIDLERYCTIVERG